MDKPLVSIVTPCYNGERYLGRFLQSVLNQTYTNIELVLINDGSTDKTEETIDNFRPVFENKGINFITEFQPNAGQAAALNRGLKLFTGKYLSCVDSDDELMPQFIETKVEYMEQNPDVAFCYGKAIEVNESASDVVVRTYEKRNKTGRYEFFEDIIYVRNIFYPGYLFRADCVDTAIPERKIYTGTGGQNAQLLLPFAWYYGEPAYVGESVYKYYVRSDSHSHSINSSEKIINQFYNYEKILTATIENLNDSEALKYISVVKKYYSKLRFGNAVDTKNPQLITKQYKELKNVRGNTFRDFLLYFKYTNKLMRKIFVKG